MLLADRLLLNAINRQLEDPHVPTDRLFEILSELRRMGRRYECEIRLAPVVSSDRDADASAATGPIH